MQHPEKKVVLVAFNSMLKQSTRQLKEINGLENMEVHTFHSACLEYYGEFDAAGVFLVNEQDRRLLDGKKLSFDILIIDEAQDVRPLLFQLACKLLRDNANRAAQMVVVGDTRQAVYEVRGGGRCAHLCLPIFPPPAATLSGQQRC